MKGTLTLKRDGRIGIKEPSPPKVPRRTRVKALLQQVFAERWPLAFDKTQVRPLQIGVGAEIEAALKGEVPRRLVRQAISYWVHASEYLASLARPGAMRHTLDGVPVEPVAEEHREHARARLAERGSRP
jgi:sRNA-binding protein